MVGGGPHSVADPRVGASGPRFNNAYRIVPWADAARTVTSARGSMAAVADPRGGPDRHVNGKYRVTGFDQAANAVIAASSTGNGACAVADPRTGFGPDSHRNKLSVVPWTRRAGAITGSDRVGSGAQSVADPRPIGLSREGRDTYLTGGHYGVTAWGCAAGAVSAHPKHNNGPWSVADPRCACADDGAPAGLPEPDERLVAVIRARDGTWHRPFTTLDLAALQSLVGPEDLQDGGFAFDGVSDSAWRERIGNAVPRAAARAMAEEIGRTLLLAWSGESFLLNDTPIWVRPISIALAVDPGPQEEEAIPCP